MQFLKAEQYQPANNQLYERISAILRRAFPDAVIEHIGSSSVPGLVSKGDLDIFVGVSRDVFESATRQLVVLGFSVKEDSLRTESLCPFTTGKYDDADVGLQLVENGSKFEFFRTFRDLLLENERLRERYNELKSKCTSMDDDTYRQIKSEFIETELALHRASNFE